MEFISNLSKWFSLTYCVFMHATMFLHSYTIMAKKTFWMITTVYALSIGICNSKTCSVFITKNYKHDKAKILYTCKIL